MERFCVCLLCLTLPGCRNLPTWETVTRPLPVASPQFRQVYQALAETVSKPEPTKDTSIKLSLAVQDMPLTTFARWLANQSGVSVVVQASLDSSPVSIDVQGQSVEQVLAAVARRLNVAVSRLGSVYFIGELRPEDK